MCRRVHIVIDPENKTASVYCPIRRRFGAISKRSNRALGLSQTLGYLPRCKEIRMNPNTPM